MTGAVETQRTQRPAKFADYLTIARFDHTTKHVFILPGVVLAYMLRGVRTDTLVLDAVFGFGAAILIASANYVINEWLDREYDRHHPGKSGRTAVLVDLKASGVYLEWAVFIAAGLALAWACSPTMFAICLLFALQGVAYNIAPLRTKDRAYLDVISESVNNPIRLLIGWCVVDPGSLPPSSILLSYWFGGAFLMAAKRLSEYREIVASYGAEVLTRYRASFAAYSEISLTVSCLIYATLSSFFLAVFLIKYRVEYLLTFPVFATLFGQYMALAMRPGSVAQKPEKLFAERGLMISVAALVALFIFCTFVDIPIVETLSAQDYVEIP